MQLKWIEKISEGPRALAPDAVPQSVVNSKPGHASLKSQCE